MSGKAHKQITVQRIPHRSSRNKGDPVKQAPNTQPRTADQIRQERLEQERRRVAQDQQAAEERVKRYRKRALHQELLQKQTE